MSSWSQDLRPDQHHVAGSPIGHARLLAGPGTGKTHVLVRRAQFLLAAGLASHGLLALTFTRAAAAEMRTRLAERLGEGASDVRVSTLHSYALGLLLQSRINNLPQPLRIAGDWEERHVVIDELGALLSRSVEEVRRGLTAMANDWDTLAADGRDWVPGGSDPAFVAIWQTHRQVYGYTLRSELVYQLLLGLRADPGLEPREQPDALLVDEYQDLNQCDLATIAELAGRCSASVFAAGDDDQSIYSFRSAAPAGIRDFLSHYSGAADLLLEECLRCGPAIVDLANWLIGQETGRVTKTLVSVTGEADDVTLVRFRDQDEEATGVAALVDAAIAAGTAAEDILVLFKSDRGGRVSRAVVEAINARGHRTYLPRQADEEDPDLVRLQQYLLLAQAQLDASVDHLALRCLLQLEDNRVGDKTLRTVLERAVDTGRQWGDALEAMRDPGEPGPIQRRNLLAAADTILASARAMTPAREEDLPVWVDRVARELAIDPATRQRVQEVLRSSGLDGPEDGTTTAAVDQDRPSHLQELLGALNGLSDAVPVSIPGQVTITTMHGAKGLTASTVVVCQLEDETLPGNADAAAEAEARRLLYVSITRARHHLYLCYCGSRTGSQQYMRGSNNRTAQRHLTRFLQHAKLTARSVSSVLTAS